MAKARYEFSEGSSNKFWEIELSGSSFTTTHGKIGTSGATTLKEWPDAATAKKEYDKIVAQKVKKGYALVSGKAEAASPPAAKKKKKAAPESVEATASGAFNAALAKQIDADPEDAGAWSVYADWLQGQGDPRGELGMIQEKLRAKPKDAGLLAAEKKLLRDHGDSLVGPFKKYLTRDGKPDVPGVTAKPALEPDFRGYDSDNRPMRVAWRSGFFSQIFLGDPGEDWSPATARKRGGDDEDEGGDDEGGGSLEIPKLLVEVLDSPAARFTTSLRIGMPNPGDEGNADYGGVIKALAKHPATSRLRSLYLGDISREECEVSWVDIGDVSKLYPSLGKLRSLTLRGSSSLKLGKIDLPELRELTIITGGLDKKNLAAICAAKWPKLERLELWLGSSNYGGNTTIKDLAPLLVSKNFPKLEHLGLRNCEYADDLAGAIVSSTLLAQVKSLDLSKGTLGDAGVEKLAASRDAFAHLRRIDLSDNFLAKSAKLAGTIHNAVRTKPQREPYEYDGQQRRYVALGE